MFIYPLRVPVHIAWDKMNGPIVMKLAYPDHFFTFSKFNFFDLMADEKIAIFW